MKLDDAQQTRLDDLRFMLGDSAGNLAFALDQITDAMAAINQHAVYCRVEKGRRVGQPPLDVMQILATLGMAKELVQESVQGLRQDR
ncbi:MAG: hypothetical protein ACJ8C4_17795 [Gemmataceae bacterium]